MSQRCGIDREALISLVPRQPQTPLVFRQSIEQLFTLDGTVGLHQAGLSGGNITVQCCRFTGPRSRCSLSVFQGAGQSSSSDTLQYLKRTGCVTLLRNEFEVSEVGLTHSRGYGAVPIGVIAAKHAVNDV